MSAYRIAAIVLRQWYLIRGSISRVLPLFVWVAIDMILWGFITRYLNVITASGLNFIPLLLGAVLLWDFFARVMHGVAMAFLEDVWSRNFLNFFATPLLISEYLTGLVCTSVATSTFSLIIMLFLASTIFGLSFLTFGLLIVPFLLVLFLFGIALGIFASALVLRYGPASEWFIWPIPAILSPFAGVFYPVSTLPAPMQFVSFVLPPAYVFEGMRSLLAGRGFSPMLLLWGAALAGVYILLACWFFAATHARAVKTGLIPRYSAETVS